MNERWTASGVTAVIIAAAIGVGWWKSESTSQQAIVSASNEVVEVYKNPQCGCCAAWVAHLRTQGFTVNVHEVADTAAVREQHQIPAALGSCHTATVNGYVIEGHVPAADIRRLLKEKPTVAGLAVPGMPAGSPGMESSSPQAYQTLAFSVNGDSSVFVDHPAIERPEPLIQSVNIDRAIGAGEASM